MGPGQLQHRVQQRGGDACPAPTGVDGDPLQLDDVARDAGDGVPRQRLVESRDEVVDGRQASGHTLLDQRLRPGVGGEGDRLQGGDVGDVGGGGRPDHDAGLRGPGADCVGAPEVERLGVVQLGALVDHRPGQPARARAGGGAAVREVLGIEDRALADDERLGRDHGGLLDDGAVEPVADLVVRREVDLLAAGVGRDRRSRR